MAGSTINTQLTIGVTLGTTSGLGIYLSPLTITASGDVAPSAIGATGLYAGISAGYVLNEGTIAGGRGGAVGGIGGTGAFLSGGGALINDGTVVGGIGGDGGAGGVGIALTDGGSIENLGRIAGGMGGGSLGIAGIGVALASGGSIINGSTAAANALISGSIGIQAKGTVGATVTNDGTIAASDGGVGVELAAGGTITNGGTAITVALIIGGSGAVSDSASGGSGGAGIDLAGGGSVNNSGTIGGGTGGAGGSAGYVAAGGGSGGGGIALTGSGTIDNNGMITGGAGGDGGDGGAGGIGVSHAGDGGIRNSGVVTGGAGGNGTSTFEAGSAGGGSGGAGIHLAGNSGINNSGMISGGSGGAGGTFVYSGAGGGAAGVGAGSGATGIDLAGDGSVENSGTIIGGAGGGGGSGHRSGGGGGSGGVGVSVAGNGGVRNSGMIAGGAGGAEGQGIWGGGGGGSGGAAINLAGNGSVNNSGMIAGGAGGAGGNGNYGSRGGAGGAGISSAGDGIISNSGTITGGAGGVGRAGLIPGSGGGSGGAGIVLTEGGSIGNLGRIAGGMGGGSLGIAGIGVSLASGGTIINGSTAVASAWISGSIGIQASGTVGATVTNYGTIAGSDGIAISFDSGGVNLLALGAGYSLAGVVQGSTIAGSSDTLELLGAAGAAVTVNYNALGFTNFEEVRFSTGGYATLRVANTSGTMGLLVSGFDQTNEFIALTGIGGDGVVTSNDTATDRITIAGSGGTVILQFDASDGVDFRTMSDGAGGTVLSIECFAQDTRILTDLGDIAVQDLREGDLVATLAGNFRPIAWIGTRAVDCRHHPAPRKVWPVRVAAGAFGQGRPHADLWLSPDHAVYLNDVLIPIKYLIDGDAITQVERDAVTYYHVELASHDILLAEGLPVESYLDTGCRDNFANGGPVMRLFPVFGPTGGAALNWEARGYAPLVVTGIKIEAVRALLKQVSDRRSPTALAPAPQDGAAPRRGARSRSWT